MTIFIDGYNLLKTVLQTVITEQDRTTFIKQLQKYASIKNHVIIVVFDGGSLSGLYQESYGQVTVLYTGKYTADDVIIERVSKMPKSQVLVVSDDRMLCSTAADSGYTSIGVTDFYWYVRQALQPQKDKSTVRSQSIKTTTVINEELDTLLMNERLVVTKKNDSYDALKYKDHSNKVSKRERTLLSILKKL